MKTTAESRDTCREIASALAAGDLQGSPRLAGTTILALLDDIDELLHAKERLAPKAKDHDSLMLAVSHALGQFATVRAKLMTELGSDPFGFEEVAAVFDQLVERSAR